MPKEYAPDAYYNKYKELALKTLRSKFHDQDTAIFMIKNLYEDIEINPEAKVIQNLHDDLKDNQESLKQMNLEMQKSEKTILELRKNIEACQESKTLIEKENMELHDRIKRITNKLEESEQEIDYLKTLASNNLTTERQLINQLKSELEYSQRRNVDHVNEVNRLEDVIKHKDQLMQEEIKKQKSTENAKLINIIECYLDQNEATDITPFHGIQGERGQAEAAQKFLKFLQQLENSRSFNVQQTKEC